MKKKRATALFAALALSVMGCEKAPVNNLGPLQSKVSSSFIAKQEADRLAEFWGEGATVREMIAADDAVSFEVNVANGGRPLTTRFIEQTANEVNFFTGSAELSDIKRMRGYLEQRFPNAEWRPALGHLFDANEEQWRVFPLQGYVRASLC